MKIPRSNGVFERLDHRVLADALRTAQHECVVDLVGGMLHALRQPLNDMAGVIGIDLAHMVKPRSGLCSVAQLNPRRPIEVEAGDVFAIDPTAVDDQAIGNEHRLARAPGHLLDRSILIEPRCRRHSDQLAFAAFGSTIRVEHWYARDTGIDARGGPKFTAGREDVAMLGHIGIEIIDAHAAICAAWFGHLHDILVFEIVAHGVAGFRMRSLKSDPGCFGLSRMTLRPARLQRSAHRAAAAWPWPLRS
jgi:hypothetical protein